VTRSSERKNEWIATWLYNNKIRDTTGIYQRWHIDGQSVCKNCWMLATTVSAYKLKNHTAMHGLKGTKQNKERTCTSIAYLSNNFDCVCDKMPEKNERHLPPYLQWEDVRKDLNDYLSSQKQTTWSPSGFCTMRKTYFPDVKSPKMTRQGKCDRCLELKQMRLDAKTQEEKLAFQNALHQHNVQQMAERVMYKEKCLQSQQNKKHYLSLIMDGMNTAKLPLSIPIPNGASQIERLKLHVHGFINHGDGTKSMIGSLDHWNTGSFSSGK
jgi:hypothetical protein